MYHTGPSISLSEYKKRRAEWEKNYKEYCELHRKLNENAQFFQVLTSPSPRFFCVSHRSLATVTLITMLLLLVVQNLGGQLKKASSSEKTKIVHQISTDYQKRISVPRSPPSPHAEGHSYWYLFLFFCGTMCRECGK
jgi:hypothetical protein